MFCLLHFLPAKAVILPKLYQTCGTEDFLYDDNVRFRDLAQKLKLPLTYKEGPGEHEWGFWDNAIKEVIDWLPID